MKIIEIAALENGAHRNQSGSFSSVPDGWAIIRESEKCENFPFGSFEVEYVDGVSYMAEDSWIPGEMPEPEPIPTPETKPTVWDKLDAAYQEGVNAAYDE